MLSSLDWKYHSNVLYLMTVKEVLSIMVENRDCVYTTLTPALLSSRPTEPEEGGSTSPTVDSW